MYTYKILTLYPTGMDWNCPAFNEVLGKQLTKHHGNITVENTIRDVVSIVQTGNLQVAVYDLTKNVAYLSNAKASYESGPQYAYERLMNIFCLVCVMSTGVNLPKKLFNYFFFSAGNMSDWTWRSYSLKFHQNTARTIQTTDQIFIHK